MAIQYYSLLLFYYMKREIHTKSSTVVTIHGKDNLHSQYNTGIVL